MGVRYDPAGTTYVGTPTRGALALRAVLMPHFGVGDLGIVRDRSRCPPNGPRSEHCEARAWDPKVQAPSAVGDTLAQWCVDHADALGIQSVIWNRRVSGFDPNGDGWADHGAWRPYDGNSPHEDHVHIGLNRWAAANLTEEMVRRQLEEDMDAAQNQRLINCEAALARLDPEVLDKLGVIEGKVEALGTGGGQGFTLAQFEAAVEKAVRRVFEDAATP